MAESNVNFSGRMLLRMLVLGVIVAIVLIANVNFISELYFTRQLTTVGYVINGGIVVIFLLGLAKIVLSLLRYMREEVALERIATRLASGEENPLKGVNAHSIIARRYQTLSRLSERYAKINHSALAAILLAVESTRSSFAKYVSNILILTGVFGTIVSLSIALAGASNLLEDIQASSSMGMVIHGMSTALSTTFTAILCYLFYGYFYLKLGDAQTNVLGKVEEITSVYLLPRFSRDSESLLHEVTGLVSGLREAAVGIKQVQQDFVAAGDSLDATIGGLAESVARVTADISQVKQLLRDGFRLPPAGN
ncbi:MAG: MotA/TolQ/ExbB proton channel family protein [Gammaproteobacteria bacterium]|nr:MotA/TolQ/ExbB proton channel family protein [Gammaproteobacteria bacterium]